MPIIIFLTHALSVGGLAPVRNIIRLPLPISNAQSWTRHGAYHSGLVAWVSCRERLQYFKSERGNRLREKCDIGQYIFA